MSLCIGVFGIGWSLAMLLATDGATGLATLVLSCTCLILVAVRS